jgi:hypothetical protein
MPGIYDHVREPLIAVCKPSGNDFSYHAITRYIAALEVPSAA